MENNSSIIKVTKKLVPTILLICSLSVNVIVFLKSGRINFDEEKEVVSWSKRAAIEGERVAAMPCSGHGRAYLDSYSLLSLDEEDDDDNEEMSVVCECNTCYTGSQCHTFIPSCPANAQSGDPLFLEPFWIKNAARSAILVSGWHRMSYYFNQTGYMSKQLENRIRNLHNIVGNAVTKEKYIIFGTGSTQLINAAIHALSPSPNNSSSPSLVVPIIPYYLLYKQQTEFFQEVEYKFEEDASLWMKKMNNDDNIIEIVTSPNNPDGKLNRARLQHPNAKAIYDRVYYWPQFTPISAPADDDIMLFSLSKLTGHAGTRFGYYFCAMCRWAVVKDETVFTKMNEYMNMNTVGVSHESQLRTLQLMKVITQGKKEEDEEETMFDFGYKTMKNRWEKLNEIISVSKRFSFQELESDQYCNFFHKIRGPSPAYAWLKCLRKEEEKDCYETMRAANILGCRGSNYGAQEKYRVELNEVSWSRKAAKEAEVVASISCSGHGRAYIDSTIVNVNQQQQQQQQQQLGGPVCECNSCYGGPYCSQLLPSCPADADRGDPYFLEPFWMENAAMSAILVSGWHRMSYTFNHSSFMSIQLENRIRNLHDIVGNAITKEKYIIFGSGTTQLINAAIHALSNHNSSSPSKIVASIPFFPLYKQQTEFFQEVDYTFEGDASLWMNKMNNYSNNNITNLIEMVTSPNNPDGQLKCARFQHPNAKAIYDRVYYWPHYTTISTTPADDDIMLFSLSKLTGHGGSRFGWAVVKDKTVFEKMDKYLSINTMGVSHESQLRALKLMKVVIEGKEGETLFDFGYKTLSYRWEKLSEVISVSKRFSLQEIEPEYCNFFHKIRGPSPAYAWLKCLREEEKDCYAVLTAANIIGRRGSNYGAEDRYVRLSLIRTQDDFDQLLHRLKILISEENTAKSI
ncbi:hypothetical protein CsatB_006701 [Cannabis sativa]